MANIIIHLSKENVQDLIKNRDIIVGSDKKEVRLSVTVPPNSPKGSVFDLFREHISKLKQNGCLRTAETYTATFNKLRRFCNNKDIAPSDITPELMGSFETWLRNQQLAKNTSSFHLRKVKALYNKAVERGLTVDVHPFRDVYTGIDKTQKRAITIDDIRRMKSLVLDDPMDAFARDMFIFSFCTRGMAFVDMAYLRMEDVNDGILTYRRKKTGKLLSIRWESYMQEIVERYPSKTGFYLLPIIHSLNGKERNQYRHIQALVNESLKYVGQLAKIDQKLTMYVARHSWASIAREMGIPLNVISHGMGHSDEKTTEIYLKSVDMTVVDDANRDIIRCLE